MATSTPDVIMNIRKVRAVPTPLVKDTLYLVQATSNDPLTIVAVDSAGNTASSTIDASGIQALINRTQYVVFLEDLAALTAYTGDRNAVIYVSKIAGENQDQPGAYLYEASTGMKLPMPGGSGGGGTGGPTNWVDVIGRPASSPGAIDGAVADRHTHTNMTDLNKIGSLNGQLTYDGAVVSTARGGNSNW